MTAYPAHAIPAGTSFQTAEGTATIVQALGQRVEYGKLRPYWDYRCRLNRADGSRYATYAFQAGEVVYA